MAKALQASTDELSETSAEFYRNGEHHSEPAYPANAKRADALEKLFQAAIVT